MIRIAYPEPSFRYKEEGKRRLIFDSFRKKWLVLTPEEWVRQNFLQYLVRVAEYPPALIAVEKEFRLGELSRRFDILVYDRQQKPWMMVECKSPDINMDQPVLDQLLRYNMAIPVPFLVITNGDFTYGWERTGQGLLSLGSLPGFVP